MAEAVATPSCLIHFNGGKGPLTRFTDTSFKTFLTSHELWLTLDGQQREIAESTTDVVRNIQSLDEPSNIIKNLHYHKVCYSKFTNVTLIKRAQDRCAGKQETGGDEEMEESEDSVPARKLLRSSASSAVKIKSRSQAILTPVCIICNEEKSYVTEPRTKKRKLDNLVSAETIDGGKLREAATKKDDQRILVHILDNDCVALEVKYHKRCYERYTPFLRHTGPQKETKCEVYKYNKSFESFCTFVKQQVIDSHNIYYMSRLVKTVFHRPTIFHRPKRRFTSEIVYAEDLSQGSVAERALNQSEEQIDLDTTEDEEEGEEDTDTQGMDDRRVALKELYSVALELRENIRSYSASWYENWPPLASDITGESVEKVISPLLFNFIAWLLGYSDDPEESGYVDIGEELTVKVFSICQDLVYNSSKGKTQTPKSIALAMAVRQLSGCSGLIRILNGLGHCVSLSSTMSYDTALARLVVDTSDIIPREFVTKEAINLIYDNIDFGEDIKKQTHVTHGIITQDGQYE